MVGNMENFSSYNANLSYSDTVNSTDCLRDSVFLNGAGGQGSGSYPNGSNQLNTANVNSGGGSVIITKL
jgi:hypothetical protein